MRPRFIIFYTYLLAFLCLYTGLQAQEFKLPAYEKFTLKNGMTIYLMEQHEVPLVYISTLIKAGAISDGEKSGLASLTANALLYDTKSYTKSQIEEEVDFIGANLNTSGGLEFSRITSSFAAKDQDLMLKIIHEVLTSPKFNSSEFEKAKKRTLAGLTQQRESPRSVIGSYYNKFMYGDHVYANPVSGTVPGVEKVKIEDIQKFYQENYLSTRTAMAIVGDFNMTEMKKKISTLFDPWKTSKTKPLNTPEAKLNFSENQILLVNKSDSRETTFRIGGTGVSRNNPDFVALTVVNTVLGARFTSWLNDALRVNAGLTYGAGSRFASYQKSGSFYISSFTKNSTTVEAIDMALDVLDSLHQHGINQETLTSAKNYVKGGFPPDYETNGSLANLLMDMYFYGFNESFINTFQKNVDELDVAKAKTIVQKYFPKDNLQFVLIGKAEEIREQVKKYGKLYEKEIKEQEF